MKTRTLAIISLLSMGVIYFACNKEKDGIDNKCIISIDGVRKEFICREAIKQYSNQWFLTYTLNKEKIHAYAGNSGGSDGMVFTEFSYIPDTTDTVAYGMLDNPVYDTMCYRDMSSFSLDKTVKVKMSSVEGGIEGTVSNGVMYLLKVTSGHVNSNGVFTIDCYAVDDSVVIGAGTISAKWTKIITY